MHITSSQTGVDSWLGNSMAWKTILANFPAYVYCW